MKEAESAEQLRLFPLAIVLAREAAEALKRDQRAALDALRLDVEGLERCLCQVHPELAAQFEAMRAIMVRKCDPEALVKRERTTVAGNQASLYVPWVAICPLPMLSPHWYTASAWVRTSLCYVWCQGRREHTHRGQRMR
jgi:hypothetical protein